MKIKTSFLHLFIGTIVAVLLLGASAKQAAARAGEVHLGAGNRACQNYFA